MKYFVGKALSVMLGLAMIAQTAGCAGGGAKGNYEPVSGLDTSRQVNLKIATTYETDKALNEVANDFMEKYPNVNISLEYVEDYDTNAISMLKNNAVDIFFQKDVTYSEEEGSTTDDFYYDFAADEELDFSDTNVKIMGNYTHTRLDENNQEITYQYAVPLGGEVRGTYVNTTFLESKGLTVPTNYQELLECCEALKKEGYVAIQGNPSTAAVALALASAANGVIHDDAAYELMKSAGEGVSQLFTDPMNKLYELASKRYYDYKRIEGEGNFTDSSEIGQARSFLGISVDKNTFETIKPENNIGYVAFFPYVSSTNILIQRLIEENQLDCDIEFIPSPLNDEGSNSPVYFTPFYGICGNKNSENLIWIREFVNYIFQKENNKKYAENAGIIPNTEDAVECLAKQYHVDADTDCVLCGEIYFSSDYNGYRPLYTGLTNTIKCSAQKYMVVLNKDADGNIQYLTDENGKEYLLTENEDIIYKEYVGEEDSSKPGYAFCTLNYYEDKLEKEFEQYREE